MIKTLVRVIFSFAIVVNLHAIFFMGALFANFAELSSVGTACEAIVRCAFPAAAICRMHSSLDTGVSFVILMLLVHVLWASIIAAVWTQLKNGKSQNIMLKGSAKDAHAKP